MKKFNPSSAAFMLADTVVTKYDSGCLRSILLKANKVKGAPPPDIYREVGAVHEDRHEEDLKADDRVMFYQREVVVKTQLSKDVEYSGRLDVKVQYEGVDGYVIHETKGTISKNTRRDVIRKRQFNPNYLAQLVSYMVRERTTKGKLVCGYYEVDDTSGTRKWVRQEEHTFKIMIQDSGAIYVDGEPSGFEVADLLAHQKAAARVLETNTVEPTRPDKWNQKYGGPCSSCVFANVCSRFDAGELSTTEEFIEAARVAAKEDAAKPRKDPEPFHVKAKKGDKGNGGKKGK